MPTPAAMTPTDFIAKWSARALRERHSAQSHFNDLCAPIGEPTPASDIPPRCERTCFERGATNVGGGDGWADVWRRGCSGRASKGKHKDLNAALRQLQIYAPDLENPPSLVDCGMERILVRTHWTNTARRTLEFASLREPKRFDELRMVFRGSDGLKPTKSPQELTAVVAEHFADLGQRLQAREDAPSPQRIVHFLNRLIFCLFATTRRGIGAIA